MILKSFDLHGKTATLYCTNPHQERLPLIVINSFGEEAEGIFSECVRMNCRDFLFLSVSNVDWRKEMTPYPSGSDYLGQADEYIQVLVNSILPAVQAYLASDLHMRVSYFGIAGYSLGGLFAVYSGYQTALFSRFASASGSFWYPGILEYFTEKSPVARMEKLYFSLGNREDKTKNKAFRSVKTNTLAIAQLFLDHGSAVFFEENEGNHFQDAEWRMAKGINWLLQQPDTEESS